MLPLREEFEVSAGRSVVRGKMVSRKHPKRANLPLWYKPNIPIAVIEAKKNTVPVGHGMQQALGYAERLKVPFAISSNGDGFVLHDRNDQANEAETNLRLDQFPSPEELCARYRQWKGHDPTAKKVVRQDYHDDGEGKTPHTTNLMP